MLRYVFNKYLNSFLCLATLTACGGSGGNTTPLSQQVIKSTATATLKVSLIGTLPATDAISGADFTINLPANVTPKNTNGSVDPGVVEPSGTFAGSTVQVVYSAAASTLRVFLPSSVPTGLTQVGEAATITLLLANNSAPSASSFSIASASVLDVATVTSINGIGVAISSVTLQ